MKTSQIQDIVQRYEERTWGMSRVHEGGPCRRIQPQRYPRCRIGLRGGPCTHSSLSLPRHTQFTHSFCYCLLWCNSI